MRNEAQNKAVEFFDTQFKGQIRDHDYALNPFEIRALDHLRGRILDLGCGLGNLSLEAARRGHSVVAVDASKAAVVWINANAQRKGLPVKAVQEDIEGWMIDKLYDTIVAIGLLMFFPREPALELLRGIQENVSPAGIAVVNVLIEGTTYMDMFDANKYYLFARNELEEHFSGWKILSSSLETFPAPEGTQKTFSTVIAEKPSETS
jgi:tellurite methyltransferase